MKTTLNSIYLPSENPRGVFIGTREEGGQGTNPGPKRRARRGRVRRFEPRAVLSVSCQFQCPVSGLQPLVLTNQLF